VRRIATTPQVFCENGAFVEYIALRADQAGSLGWASLTCQRARRCALLRRSMRKARNPFRRSASFRLGVMFRDRGEDYPMTREQLWSVVAQAGGDEGRDILKTLIPGIVIALVTAVATVWLALKRFYSEQWWSRKAQAYVDILTALFKLKTYLMTRWRNQASAEVRPADEMRAREGYDDLLRASAVNALFISPEAQNCVESALGVAADLFLPDTYESVEPNMTKIQEVIDTVRNLANRELKGR
jgi:hypothetical protein